MKELPYFKFYCDEWRDGDITLLDYSLQGVFINVCSYYWKRNCSTSFGKLKLRFPTVTQKEWDVLLKAELITVYDKDILGIKFLDEQFIERTAEKDKKSMAGMIGANARWDKPAKEAPLTEVEEPDTIELIERPNPKQAYLDRKLQFRLDIRGFIESYPNDILESFYDYWSEKHKTLWKMRWETQKTWELPMRIKTWFKRSADYGKESEVNTVSTDEDIEHINSIAEEMDKNPEK